LNVPDRSTGIDLPCAETRFEVGFRKPWERGVRLEKLFG
jgi:hypothetical protein